MSIKNKAFTLIELLVSITIVGLLSSVSVAVYNNYISEAKISLVKRTVNDLYRYTILYAKEENILYSEISLESLTNKFGIAEMPYGQIAYIADDYDFLYLSAMPTTEDWWAINIVEKVYAVVKSKDYYVSGTPNGISFYEGLSDVMRESFIIAAYSQNVNSAVINVEVNDVDFSPKLIKSPWKYEMEDSDYDGIPDYIDKCPEIPGQVENTGCPEIDTDGDGVWDSDDDCLNTPGDQYNFGCPIGDADEDGVLDDEDACPEEKGSEENNGCPEEEQDADEDGVLDDEDACPEEKGSEENNGCPEEEQDADEDGVLDNEDACPEEKGPEESYGCPDKDGDGVPDIKDACPEEKGSERNKGCPEK